MPIRCCPWFWAVSNLPLGKRDRKHVSANIASLEFKADFSVPVNFAGIKVSPRTLARWYVAVFNRSEISFLTNLRPHRQHGIIHGVCNTTPAARTILMSMSKSSKQVPASASKDHPALRTPSSAARMDQELEDWDTYYKMLLAGRLNKYAGEFIVIHQGKLIASGADPDALRASAAKTLGIAADRLVIPFVDNKDCIAIE